MEEDLLIVDTTNQGLISYLRYNQWLDSSILKNLIGREYTQKQIENLLKMSNVESRFELYDIGCKAAQTVEENRFPEHFKITNPVLS